MSKARKRPKKSARIKESKPKPQKKQVKRKKTLAKRAVATAPVAGKRAGVSAKKSAVKTATRKAVSRRGPRLAVAPPDDPMRRHRALQKGEPVLGGSRVGVAELERPRGVAARGVATARAVDEAPVGTRASLRAAALAAKEQLPESDGGPAGVPGSHAVAMVAPVAGMSNWIQLGPTAVHNGQTYGGARVLVTGRVTSLAIHPEDPNLIYLGAAQGGVWRTTDRGVNWTPLTDHEVSLAIGALALDPYDPRVIYAATGEGNFSGDSYYGNGVLKSTDGGDTWTLLGSNEFAGARFSRIAVTPGTPQRIWAATNAGLYRSTNGGSSWSQLTSGLPSGSPATDVVIDSADPSTVYAAFWAGGIYRTHQGGSANPSWTKLASALPTSGFTRIALAISPSAPQTVFALMANDSYTINGFYRTANGGTSWTKITLPGGNIGGQGFYNLFASVDPTTPDIVYLCGVSVWKAVKSGASGSWTISEIGSMIHPDNHAIAFDPTNHDVVYAGNDGGIYRSDNAGTDWVDRINEGPCITQFEFIDHHPTSPALVIGGTQDNGTEQYRNSTVFYHSDDGDGGCALVDKKNPKVMVSSYYGASPKRSTQSGKFGTWFEVWTGLDDDGLFYPPIVMDDTNSKRLAVGTRKVHLDSAQGQNGWPTKVSLPGIAGDVSAIHYVNSSRIYAATSTGQVYRLSRSGATWTADAIHAAPLPSGSQIWDIAARPDDASTVIAVFDGFGFSHVWRGSVPSTGVATWTDISGGGPGTLPNVPVNALVIDKDSPDTYYIATDVAVFRTTNAGASWTQFSQGLPNCAVFDLKLHSKSRLLRAATHGRGLWERKLDAVAMSDVDLYVRDNVMDTGRGGPTPSSVKAAFEDPTRGVTLGATLNPRMCADIKVDALEGPSPAYQMNVAEVDYAAFEARLYHRNPRRGQVNRVYVQINNRGIKPASQVSVKLLYAKSAESLPALPADFWSAFPNDSAHTSVWKPIGAAKLVPTVSHLEPLILSWDWSTPEDAPERSCLLVVVDCAADPIPPGNRIRNVQKLSREDKRVGLLKVRVV